MTLPPSYSNWICDIKLQELSTQTLLSGSIEFFLKCGQRFVRQVKTQDRAAVTPEVMDNAVSGVGLTQENHSCSAIRNPVFNRFGKGIEVLGPTFLRFPKHSTDRGAGRRSSYRGQENGAQKTANDSAGNCATSDRVFFFANVELPFVVFGDQRLLENRRVSGIGK